MIELEHVTKLYGSIPGLRDVSLHVPKGQTVGLLGRNGAGKTTALNLMTGYFPRQKARYGWAERICWLTRGPANG